LFVTVVLASMAGPGCAKKPVQAAPVPLPPLEVPVPPPRVLAPVVPPAAPAPEPAPVPETPPAPRPRPPRPTGQSGEARPDAAKPDGATEAPAAPAQAGETSRPVEPTSGLRTPQNANDVEAERRIRDVLGRAGRSLEAINRAVLSADARAQFDTARRFIDQASGALKARNYMFAAYLADKADTLARGLAGR
jgi:hypothetical protein